MLCTPAYGGLVHVTYMESVMRLSTIPNVEFILRSISNESLVTRARNTLVHEFLKTECTHLLFIDADIGFQPEAVVALLNGDFGVSAIAYARKGMSFEKLRDNNIQTAMSYAVNLRRPSDGPYTLEFIKDEFVETLEASTGFFMIKRHVLEEMIQAYPELMQKNEAGETVFGLFDCMIEPGTRRAMSEDYSFCRRWSDMGGKVYLNLKHNLSHTGAFTFMGNYIEHLKVAM